VTGLPNPRIFTVFPCGGRAGCDIEVTLSGQDLDGQAELLFSHPGIKGHALGVPAPASPKLAARGRRPGPPPTVLRFRIQIAPDTPLGIHDLRVVNRWGISNPRGFVVGDLPEILEREPNNDVSQAQRVGLNATVNGVIATPTDVDYYLFAGKKGQRVILSCLASTIDSRLRAGLDLYDPDGRQLAFNYHYHDTDALVDCTLPSDGDYTVRVYEYTYTKGNAEHFYRLTLSTGPWIDAVFPPVVEPGHPSRLVIYGRNLPGGRPDPDSVVGGRVLDRLIVNLDTPEKAAASHHLDFSTRLPPVASALDGFEFRLRNPAGVSNPFLMTYATAPLILENDANHDRAHAQTVTLPCEIAGRLSHKHNRDWYAFAARKGEVYSIELFGDRLGAPEDVYFRLYNAQTGKVLGEFDDDPETLAPQQFYTRTLDPPLYRFAPPADGRYLLMVTSREVDSEADARGLYLLRIGPEQPDFRLIVMPPASDAPDACVLRQGGRQYYTVFVWRRDGWNGPITLAAEDLPEGVSCPIQGIGPGMKQGVLVLNAAADVPVWTGSIRIKGTAVIGGRSVVREARPASITWPVLQPRIPAVSRLDHQLVLAVREKDPYRLDAGPEPVQAVQGGKASIPVHLERLWPDWKGLVQVNALNLPANVIFNRNNQPTPLPANAKDFKAVLDVRANAAPGMYSLVLRGQAQVPFSKEPGQATMNVAVIRPSNPISLTIWPKQLAALQLAKPNLSLHPGERATVAVRVKRLSDYGGAFRLRLVLPSGSSDLVAEEAVIAAGKDEGQLVLEALPKATVGKRATLTVRASAVIGSLSIPHEVKLSVEVVN
jgi:hypothetical protein